MKSEFYTAIWDGRDHEASERNYYLSATKAGLHPKKVMLCIWWDWKGVLYYEFLLENQMMNPASTAPN